MGHIMLYVRWLFTDRSNDGISSFEEMEQVFFCTCGDKELLDHTPVILIRRSSSGVAIARRYAHGTMSSMPWGFLIPPCGTCNSHINVAEEYRHASSNSIKLHCLLCGAKCTYTKLDDVWTWEDRFNHDDRSTFWVSTFPIPNVQKLEWTQSPNWKCPRSPMQMMLKRQ